MKVRSQVTRRQALLGGLAALGGIVLPGCSRELPPTCGNLLRMGDVHTHAAHRTLLSGRSLAREYSHKHISSVVAIGTTDPADPAAPLYSSIDGPAYGRLRDGAFADWRLSVEGAVARP